MSPICGHANKLRGSMGLLLVVGLALSTASATPVRVLVTGAGGKTGALAFKKLAERPEQFAPFGLARSSKAAKKLRSVGASTSQVIRSDIMDTAVLAKHMADAKIQSLVICTSATPQIKKRSILKIMVLKLLRRPAGRPTFRFPPRGTPEEVDYYGCVAQIDAAKKAGVNHVVLVSSMGGTDRSNFLNTIGVKPDGSGGEILIWKRKAEKYIAQSGLPYTIIHPGGLIDTPGGRRKIVAGVDDELLKRTTRNIPRADVAEVCVQALLCPDARNLAIDIISEPEGEGEATSDFGAFFRTLATGPRYDYSKDPGEPVPAPAAAK